MKTTLTQRYKYTIVYNFTRLGSFWQGWADAIDGTWEHGKELVVSLIRVPIGLIICAGWPIIAFLGVIWKCLIWPLTYIVTRKDDMEKFMEQHPDPVKRITKNFTI